MKSITIPITMENGTDVNLRIQFDRDRKYTYDELEKFVKSSGAKIKDPEKFRKHLSKLQ